MEVYYAGTHENSTLSNFLTHPRERSKLRRNEFRRKGYLYPFQEIHLAGGSSSLEGESKNWTKSRRKHPIENTPSLKTFEETDLPISVDEFFKDCFGDLPQWAVVLRGLRNREGLTQAAMGNLLGIPQGNISQMERGKRPIGKQIAKRLAELFHTDYHFFL